MINNLTNAYIKINKCFFRITNLIVPSFSKFLLHFHLQKLYL